MVTRLDPVDVVIVGSGWTGGIIGKECALAGMKTVMLEKGSSRATVPDFQPPWIHDDVRYVKHYELEQDLSRQTLTFRHTTDQAALPMRWYGSFRPGEGTGGASVHWAGQNWRFLPYDFQIRTMTAQRYGANAIPPEMTLQDWGVTYDEMEPYFDKEEYTMGTSGKAGNLKGQIQEGGNPFEGPRSRDYPTPPMKVPPFPAVAIRACNELGLKVFPQPSSTISQPYRNPDGQQLGGCVYCGQCAVFGCEVAAKASSLTTVLPVAMASPNFTLRHDSWVQKVNLDSGGQRAVSVTYIDGKGEEFEQPAEIIVLAAYALWNVHLMLLSGIGQPYDPATGQGVVGKNYCYQSSTGATLFFDDRDLKRFMGAGAAGQCIDEFNGDNFDHTGLGFFHGGNVAFGQGGSTPFQGVTVPQGTPSWGSDWKAAAAKYFNRNAGFGTQMAVLPNRGHYLDLDPTYKDIFGRPLLRMTFNWTDNERKMSEWLAPQMDRIARAMGATNYRINTIVGNYNIVPYQSTHNTGGAIMGSDPSTSVVNPWLQCWSVPNVFSASAASFAHNSGYNPTGTVCALAYRAADGIVNRYRQNPGPLA